jgi:hypothetical protein
VVNPRHPPAGMLRNGWPAWPGISGRHAPESVAGMGRNPQLDYAIPYTAWEGVIDGLGNLDYILLEEDSHNPRTEFPERFDPAFVNWLRN